MSNVLYSNPRDVRTRDGKTLKDWRVSVQTAVSSFDMATMNDYALHEMQHHISRQHREELASFIENKLTEDFQFRNDTGEHIIRTELFAIPIGRLNEVIDLEVERRMKLWEDKQRQMSMVVRP